MLLPIQRLATQFGESLIPDKRQDVAATLVTGYMSKVSPLFLQESSPCLAGLFRSKVLRKTGRRLGEDSARYEEGLKTNPEQVIG